MRCISSSWPPSSGLSQCSSLLYPPFFSSLSNLRTRRRGPGPCRISIAKWLSGLTGSTLGSYRTLRVCSPTKSAVLRCHSVSKHSFAGIRHLSCILLVLRFSCRLPLKRDLDLTLWWWLWCLENFFLIVSFCQWSSALASPPLRSLATNWRSLGLKGRDWKH